MAELTCSLSALALYYQFAVMDRAIFNPWTGNLGDQQLKQGFAWRPGYVTFFVLHDFHESLSIDVLVGTPEEADQPIVLPDDVLQAVEVPFTVPAGGELAIATICMEDKLFSVPPGNYKLRCAIAPIEDEENPPEDEYDDNLIQKCWLTFLPCANAELKVLREGPHLQPTYPLLMGTSPQT